MAASLALVSGCLVERPYDLSEPDLDRAAPNDVDVRAYAPARAALGGFIEGEIGPAQNISHDASALSAYDDGYYLSVETVVELQGRAAMTLLSISDPAAVMRPGYVGDHSLETYNSGGVNVTVLGCVGQEMGVYDEYDMPADDVHIGVDEGQEPGQLDVALQARWFDHDPATGVRLATFRQASTQFTLVR
jgi:hypothetical protein